MATVMTITVTFDDANNVTTSIAHELTSAIALFLASHVDDDARVAAVTLDYSAGDVLTVVVT